MEDKTQVDDLVSRIKKDIVDWTEHRRNINQSNLAVTEIPWTLPQSGFCRSNFDASFYKFSKRVGAALIGIDDACGFQGAWCIPSAAENEEQAEALAAYESKERHYKLIIGRKLS